MSLDVSPYAAVLLDLDGTVYHEDHALPGAIDLLRRLQELNHPFACLTNSTTSPQRLAMRLGRMGVQVPAEAIYTAAAAAVDRVLAGRDRPPRVFNLASEGIAEMLDGRATWVSSGAEPCDFVIVGAPANVFATDERQRVALQLLRKGAALIGICADRVYPSPRGIEFGSGAFSWMLGYASAVEPQFCGKPEPIFFHELCQRLGVSPEQCLLIGDNLESDIAGAKRVGMRTILTLTGVTRRRDVMLVDPAARPDAIVEDLRELL